MMVNDEQVPQINWWWLERSYQRKFVHVIWKDFASHRTFQWRLVYYLIGLYWSLNPRLELRQSDYWSWIAMVIKSRNFMSDAWFSMGWAAQVFWESVSSESPHRVDLLLTWGTAFSALPDLFTGFHQLTSFCHFSSDFGVGVLSFFIQAWEYAGNFWH